MTTQIVVTNETEDVAEVRTVTIGSAEEGDLHSVVFEGAAFEYEVGAAETPTDVASALQALIAASAIPFTASASLAEIEVTADRAGRPFALSVSHPNDSVALTTAAEQAVDVPLPGGFSRTVPEAGQVSLQVNLTRLPPGGLQALKDLETAGLVSVLPPIEALQGGEVENLTVPDGVTLTMSNIVVNGDLSVAGDLTMEGCRVEGDAAMAAGTLTGEDCYFGGDLDNNSDPGTVTLNGGRVIGAKSGTITHTQGDSGS